MITYHPSYLLHNPSKSGKRKVWEDMLKVMERVGSEITERQKNFFPLNFKIKIGRAC